jgi:urease accessory protein UreF
MFEKFLSLTTSLLKLFQNTEAQVPQNYFHQFRRYKEKINLKALYKMITVASLALASKKSKLHFTNIVVSRSTFACQRSID